MGRFSRSRRRLWSTAVRFGRYNLALALRSKFFTEFIIISNSYLLIDNRKIKYFARTEHDIKGLEKKLIICNQEPNSNAVLMVPQRKLHILKILQKIRKQLWIEYFDEVKSNATYSVPIAKHAPSKVWHFSLLFTLLKRKIYHHFVGQSRKSWSAHCLAFLIFFSG